MAQILQKYQERRGIKLRTYLSNNANKGMKNGKTMKLS